MASIDEPELEPSAPEAPERSDPPRQPVWPHISWLLRWIGIPFFFIVSLFYAEPLFRGGPAVEHVPMMTRQEVHPYPLPEGPTAPSFTPPGAPPLEGDARKLPDATPATPPSGAEVVASPIEQPKPIYPRRALEAQKEGFVRVRITIGADGLVQDAQVVASQPVGWFESAALAAVRRWRYQPPGRVLITEAEIEFKLE